MYSPAKTVRSEFIVVSRTGQERFVDLEAAVLRYRYEIGRALDWKEAGRPQYAEGIPLEHRKHPVYLHFPSSLLFLDELGCIIPAAHIYICYQTMGLDWRRFWTAFRRPNRHHVFRQGPVPGTGGRRGSWSCWFRRPSTIQELRRNEADRLDGLITARDRRRSVDLDIDFDDKTRARRSRGWKEHRKTQWKNRRQSIG